MMNPLEIAVRKSLAKLVTALGDKLENPEESVFVYLEALRDLEPLDIEGGASRAIRAERFFPRPAVLRAYALEERTGRTVSVRPITQDEGTLCSLCGSKSRWLRDVQQPDPDPKHWTEAAIRRGDATPRAYQRDEVRHDHGCPLKREDQPSQYAVTRGAA
jgi:hypothetical protein